MKKPVIVIIVVILSLLLPNCGSRQALGPALTPTPTSTITPTPTITSTPEPTATSTLLPTATIPFGTMSNPAMEVIDISVTVEGDLVTAIFYLKDVPTEMEFHREGVPENQAEYSWSIYFDTDNDMYTGSSPAGGPMWGNDYELTAYYVGVSVNAKKESCPLKKRLKYIFMC